MSSNTHVTATQMNKQPAPARALAEQPAELQLEALAASQPAADASRAILRLQRTVGNQAMLGILGKTLGNEEELQKAAAFGDLGRLHAAGCGCALCGPLTKTLGDEEELAKRGPAAGAVQRAVQVHLTAPAAGARPDLLRKSSVRDGAAPSHALGAGTYGLTFPERVEADLTAKRSGSDWVPVVTNLIGHYSKQVRLLPGQSEVTGPGGNTTQANYLAQIENLHSLGNTAGNPWYMLAAVNAHEGVHATRFLPALNNVEAAIVATLVRHTVPDAAGMNAATAVTQIKALPAYQADLVAAQATWLTEILTLVAGDHAAGGPCETAEHTIVDPMKARICDHAKKQKWPASPHC